MIEKNRNILKKLLNELPKRKAAPSNWKNISGSLDHLETKQFFSKTLSSLPNYKAPANTWNEIEKALKKPLLSFASQGIIKIGTAFAVAITVLISILIFLPDENDDQKNVSQTTVLTSNKYIKTDKNTDKEIKKSQKDLIIPNKEKIKTENIKNNSTTQFTNNSTEIKTNKTVVKISDPSLINKQTEKIEDFSVKKENSMKNLFQTQKLKNIKSKNGIIKSFGFKPVFSLTNSSKLGKAISWDYYRKQNAKDYYISAYYSLINYQNVSIENMEVPESVSSFGLDFIIEKRKFFFKTGISYLSWKEKAKYIFDYNQNEYLLSYNYVDSAFMDISTGDIEYFTTLKDVYDSVAHQMSDKSEYQYQLLQIPLIIGYKFVENKYFKISLNAGVGFDIRIGGHEYLPVFNQQEASIINTVNYLDYRVDINYRFISGFSVLYRISDRFSIHLEPSYQQYIKSVYKNVGLKGVSYFEIKTGVVYKFK